jgi:arylsulfatase A-like enzyme
MAICGRIGSVAAVVGAAMVSMAATPVMAAAGNQRPNILMIVADDLGWGDVGWHGGFSQTPHMDRLVAEGNANDLVAAEAVRQIRAGAGLRNAAGGRQPWFLYVAFHAVHTPVDAPVEFKRLSWHPAELLGPEHERVIRETPSVAVPHGLFAFALIINHDNQRI